MRLSTHHREAFVRAVMDDVPEIDFDEQARVLVQKWATAQLPAKLRALHREFSDYFQHESVWLPGSLGNVMCVTNTGAGDTAKRIKEAPELHVRLNDLSRAKTKQADERRALRAKVTSAIGMCSTLKQAHERLPEFAKYLPAIEAATDRSVPVVANLVAELAAAGWPKDKKPAARKAA
ncbi:Nmad5 family putative nucleotide modification protein [Burkholderia gladioli]|uniref:Nmad5 family putative nucleotide modification protein n=1 Tax=Burkholderia gladioli TaxID=28095 RepID=UPI00163EF5CC|nr:Nmad5 family putative nucleotide modification protein [Burkholderia gladioli]